MNQDRGHFICISAGNSRAGKVAGEKIRQFWNADDVNGLMDERHGRLPLYSVPCPEALDISKPPKVISDFQGPIRSCFALVRLSHSPAYNA